MTDRIFAMWQVLYPDSYVEPERTAWGTFTTPRNSIEDVNTSTSRLFSSMGLCTRLDGQAADANARSDAFLPR